MHILLLFVLIMQAARAGAEGAGGEPPEQAEGQAVETVEETLTQSVLTTGELPNI